MDSATIERQPGRDAGSEYDLIVVGGGIYGAALLLESARRGLRTLLVEKGDFGAATSWNNLRIVHGGLRYLQGLDLHRFRESVSERRWFLRTFPGLVSPLRCLMPLYGQGLKRTSVLRVALGVNDLLSRRRNDGVRNDRHLPGGRVLDPAATVAAFSGVDRDGLRGAAQWYDAVMPKCQRILIEMLRAGARLGARSLNYVEARDLLVEGRCVRGVRAVDLARGGSHEFRASTVVNCAGPWSPLVAKAFGAAAPELFRPSLAFNVLLARPPLSEAAVAVTPKYEGARTYFVHRWKDRLFAGTYHSPYDGPIDSPRPSEEMLAAFLDDLNLAVPGLELRRDEVLRVFAGLLPACREGTEELAVREVIRNHGADGGVAGLFSVSGVKYTTARLVAEKTLQVVRSSRDDLSLRAPEPLVIEGGDVLDSSEFLELLDEDRSSARDYVLKLTREESVLRLEDLLLRRTDWGLDPAVGESLAARVLELVGSDVALGS